MTINLWEGKRCAAVIPDEERKGKYCAIECRIINIKRQGSTQRCIAEAPQGWFFPVFDYNLYQDIKAARRAAEYKNLHGTPIPEMVTKTEDSFLPF